MSRDKKIEKLILSDSFNLDSQTLNEKQINYFLYYAYENKKYQLVQGLLELWNTFCWNEGKNLLDLLIKKMAWQEKTILEFMEKNLVIQQEILDDYYQIYQKNLKSINSSSLQNTLEKKAENFFSNKKKQNIALNLEKKLKIKKIDERKAKI